MGKRNEFKNQLQPLIDDLSIESIGQIESILITNCGIPGKRANLELAYAFADCFEESQEDKIWEAIQRWLGTCQLDALSDDPSEFLPFCALQAMGTFYIKADDDKRNQIMKDYKSFANDARWRIREAVAMGLQRIGEKDWSIIESELIKWMKECSYLEQRAIIAALAHPPILTDKRNVKFCLDTTEAILNKVHISDIKIRKSEDFRVLKKGLEYAISVFVEKLPEEGFSLLERWAAKEDKDINRIIKVNLGKKRLTRKYENQVNLILDKI